jgi:hypothetical protein
MVNPKKNKIKAALQRVPKNKFSNEDILSKDLADQVGSLAEKGKITIRLDLRVIEAAKREAQELGVGYQKIINDRLLGMYSIQEKPYLRPLSELQKLKSQIEELNKRLSKI